MKSIQDYITEKMIYKKSVVTNYKYFPETKEELKDIIKKLVDKQSTEDIINLNSIDSSQITDMSYLFAGMEDLIKIDLSDWDVSNVKTMKDMFRDCQNLERIIGIENWNVSNVTNMRYMFIGCKSFNQQLNKWDTSKISDMSHMFYDCKSFNQDISNWNVENITNASTIFYNCPIEEKHKPKFK